MKYNFLKIEEHIKNEISTKRISGASILIYKDGEIIYDNNFGYANIEKGIKISDNTRFRLASMTKPITAVATMIAVEQGLFKLDDYAYKYLPEIKDLSLKDENFNNISEEKYNFTIRQILRHNAGFAVSDNESRAIKLIKDEDLHDVKDCIKYVKSVGLNFIPGTKMGYGGSYAYNIVVRIIEVTSGMKYEDFLKKYLFEPLEMEHTSYYFNKNDEKAISYKSIDGKLIYFDDLNRGFDCYYPGYNSGGAGLISTKRDYYNFALMLLNEGVYNGKRLLKKESFLELIKYDPTPNLINGGIETFGLSFFVRAPNYSDWQKLPSGTFGWSGAYGTHFWVDPINKMIVIYMHNSSTFGGAGASQNIQLEDDVVETFGIKR